ncbi:hypothetical protein [Mycolicibacterium peregrinum]|uniref:hypothetical protein n=1 Tax=Mycolicibacterium peregrinum TaxID=43304 RepID=UPI003AAA838B
MSNDGTNSETLEDVLAQARELVKKVKADGPSADPELGRQITRMHHTLEQMRQALIRVYSQLSSAEKVFAGVAPLEWWEQRAFDSVGDDDE